MKVVSYISHSIVGRAKIHSCSGCPVFWCQCTTPKSPGITSDCFRSHAIHPEVKPSSRRLTIFEKLQIVAYIKELREKHHASIKKLRKGKTKKRRLQRKFCRGLNVQAMCAQKFGSQLRRIKVCQLEKQAQEQRWSLLTEAQQKSTVQLTDQQKMALGLSSNVKGWKSLREDASKLSEKIKSNATLPRWSVPGKVLEEWDYDR